jgi:hypothetical protein
LWQRYKQKNAEVAKRHEEQVAQSVKSWSKNLPESLKQSPF